jgi:transposase InsO family protein
MTEEQKQAVAVFRYGVIADFVGATRLDRGEREALLREKCARKWQIPHSGRTRISRSTITRWIQRYTGYGRRLESLYPQDRTDCGSVRAIDEETGLALQELRRQLPKMPVPELTRILHERWLVSSDRSVSQSTVYRFLHQHNLMTEQPAAAADRRKFEAELPNDLWQSDVMHGPHVTVGNKQRKSYLIAFIDDHSRLIPHAAFYPSEALAPFMEAFQSALGKRGIPRKLYVDNGSAFRSRQLEYTCAALGIALIHAKPYQPQGKGKIERFFRTVRTQFLPGFTGQTLEQINGAFERWLEQTYHQRRHSSTGQSPLQRFTAHMHCLRAAPHNLTDSFRKTARRRVNKDRSVVLDKRLFEAPVDLIGKRVELLYHEQNPEQVEVRFSGQSYGNLRPIDLQVNSRVKRDRNGQVELVGEARSDGGTPVEKAITQSGELWEDA